MTADPPGAVLLDLKLENIDPQAGMLAIRQISPSILLVLYSGNTAELSQVVDSAPPGLVDAAFTKPLPIQRLLELLQ